MDATQFLREFFFDTSGYMSLHRGTIGTDGKWNLSTTYVTLDQLDSVPIGKGEENVFFSPALRKTKGERKEDVLGSQFLWVDYDDPEAPLKTLPPTLSVNSGHGWHYYWRIASVASPEDLERANQHLAEDVGGDRCWNANRILRVPYTTNTKGGVPVGVVLNETLPVQYQLEDFDVLSRLERQLRNKIRTGDSRGYRSRSERDWAIVMGLINAGASDDLIHLIFQYQPCGAKARENAAYLEQTIEKARTRAGKTVASQGIQEKPDGYYVTTRGGLKRLSTFTLDPTLLLDGRHFNSEDALVCNVNALGYAWPEVTFPRSAFQSIPKLDKHCPVAAWQWLGKEEDVRNLLPYLMNKLQTKGLPRVSATPMMGLHKVGDTYFFVGDKEVLSANDSWKGYSGPISWLPSGKEHPTLDLSEDGYIEDALKCLELNTPEITWIMSGWYAACLFKPWLEQSGLRFPILNVVGTKGSGKTTLIQRVYMPLFGQTEPKSYDAGTTRFVTLAVMGSSNAIPVAFSEFRFEAVEKFLRVVLLSYDTGHDPRGRGDQTTVDYPLAAPFSVDGEDMLEDPAARERIVVAHLDPAQIEEGSPAHTTYNSHLRGKPIKGIGGAYARYCLNALQDGLAEIVLKEAREDCYEAFKVRLPDRVRSNHTVTLFGMYMWAAFLKVSRPDPSFLNVSVGEVFNLETGRARTQVDYMVEEVVNNCTQGYATFKWTTSEDGRIFWFQLSSAHSYWLSQRRRQGRGGLERDSLRSQLKEAPFAVPAQLMEGTWMYGIDLPKAQEMGLDVPEHINRREFKVSF